MKIFTKPNAEPALLWDSWFLRYELEKRLRAVFKTKRDKQIKDKISLWCYFECPPKPFVGYLTFYCYHSCNSNYTMTMMVTIFYFIITPMIIGVEGNRMADAGVRISPGPQYLMPAAYTYWKKENKKDKAGRKLKFRIHKINSHAWECEKHR